MLSIFYRSTIFSKLSDRTKILYSILPLSLFFLLLGTSSLIGPLFFAYTLAIGSTAAAVAALLYYFFQNTRKNIIVNFFERYQGGTGALEYLARERLFIINIYILGLTLLIRPFLLSGHPSEQITTVLNSNIFSSLLGSAGDFLWTIFIGLRLIQLRLSGIFNYYYSLANLELAEGETIEVIKAGHFRRSMLAYDAYLKSAFHIRMKDIERLLLSFRLKDFDYREKLLNELVQSFRKESEPEKFGLGPLEPLTKELTKENSEVLESYTPFLDNSNILKTLTVTSAIVGTILGVIQLILIMNGNTPK